jgi:hypothetical protein
MVPVPVPPDQVAAVGRLCGRSGSQAGGGLGESFCLGLKGLLQDGAVLGLGRPPGPRGSALEGLDEAIIQTSDDKLAHGILILDITL